MKNNPFTYKKTNTINKPFNQYEKQKLTNNLFIINTFSS